MFGGEKKRVLSVELVKENCLLHSSSQQRIRRDSSPLISDAYRPSKTAFETDGRISNTQKHDYETKINSLTKTKDKAKPTYKSSWLF